MLHLVYLPLANNALNAFVEQWNSHPVTSACSYTLRQLWVKGLVESRNKDYSAVNDVLVDRQDFVNLGAEEDGPVPQLQSSNRAEVAEIPFQLTQEHEFSMFEIKDMQWIQME